MAGAEDSGAYPRPMLTVDVVVLAGSEATVTGADDAEDARWFAVDSLPELAFDHALIVADALAAS